MRNHRTDDRETILPPIDLSRLRRGRNRRGVLPGPAAGGRSNQLLRILFFWFSPWLLKAGVAAIAAIAVWFWLPSANTLARLVGAGLSEPSQVTDWIGRSRARLEDLVNATAQRFGDPGGREGGSTEVTPEVVQAPDEAIVQ